MKSSISFVGLLLLFGLNDALYVSGVERGTAHEVYVDESISHLDIRHAMSLLSPTYEPSQRGKPESINDGDQESEIIEDHLTSRGKRSSYESRNKCTVSENTLKSLLREIKTTLANSRTVTNTNCDIDTNAEHCNEILKLIQCGVNHLESGFPQDSSNTDDYFNKWKNAFDNLSDKFYWHIDVVERTVTQDQQRSIDSLISQMHNLRNKLDYALFRLSKGIETHVITCYGQSDNTHTTHYRPNITSEIGNGRVSNAVTEFKSLHDDSKLPEIVRMTYNTYGGINVFDNLINFIEQLRSCYLVTEAYPALYSVMKDNNDANSPKIVVLSSHLDTYSCFEDSPMKGRVSGKVQNVLNSWATNIRNRQYSEISDFSRKYSEAFVWYRTALIEKAHGDNMQNIPNILDFIDNLDFGMKTTFLQALYYSVMRASHGFNGHEFITLMYRVKELLDRSDLTESQRNTLNVLKDNAPNGIRALLWDSWVWIRSKKHPSNYLGFRLVSSEVGLITKLANCPASTIFDKWTVEVHYRGRYFKFLNHRDKYLYDGKMIEVTPVDNGDYFYFKIDGKIMDSNDAVGLNVIGLNSDCSEPYLYDGYLGTDYHKWSIH